MPSFYIITFKNVHYLSTVAIVTGGAEALNFGWIKDAHLYILSTKPQKPWGWHARRENIEGRAKSMMD
jgi:hypothetical protein